MIGRLQRDVADHAAVVRLGAGVSGRCCSWLSDCNSQAIGSLERTDCLRDCSIQDNYLHLFRGFLCKLGFFKFLSAIVDVGLDVSRRPLPVTTSDRRIGNNKRDCVF